MKTENLIFIIVNAVLVYILYTKNNKTNMLESFSNHNELNNLSNELNNLSNELNNLPNELNNLPNESNNLQNYLEDKYLLENIKETNVYTKNTIQSDLNGLLKYYINYFLEDNFNINDLERVYEEVDDNNNYRYVIILFVYDYKKFNSNKMLIDFVINLNTEEIYINTMEEFKKAFPNIINRYDYKIYNFYENDKEHNYIGGYLSENTSDDDLLEILNKEYLNNKKLSYLKNKSLDFSNIKFKTSKKYLDNYSDINLPINQNKFNDDIFCNKYINSTWDSNGLPIELDSDCILHNTSTSINIDQPNKYPSFPLNNIEESDFNWLIDPVRNNIIRQHGYVF